MKPDHPSFSVIVPTYNRPRQLGDCLRALTALDYPRHLFEVIVVNDGSDTPLAGVVAAFRPLLQLTLITQDNAGPGAARNAGAARARGKFLAFTDDDCLPSPGWLQALETRLAVWPHRGVGGRTLNGLPHNPFTAASQFILEAARSYFNVDPEDAVFCPSNNLALAADIYRRLGGFDETFRAAEDRDLCDRWRQHGHRLTYAPEAVVYHAPALTGRRFWRQHFHYGRGAFHYHRARARRGCDPFRPDLKFHLHVLRQMQKHYKEKYFFSLVFLLAAWQIANTMGFIWENIKGKGRED